MKAYLIVLIIMLNIQVNSFSVMLVCFPVFLGRTSTKLRIIRLAQGHNTVPLVRFNLATLRSKVLTLTTELSCEGSRKDCLYSKTSVKWPFLKRPKMVFKTNYPLMKVTSVAECSKGSILQYFWPSLSYHLSLRASFCLFFSGCLRQVLLYEIS